MAEEQLPQKREPSPPPQEEGLPPWMATFADMVTLLLCFFVLLLSFANQDVQKFRDAMGSLKDAFGVKEVRAVAEDLALLSGSRATQEMASNITRDQRVFLGVIMRLKSLVEEDNDQDNEGAGITADRDGVNFSVSSANLFEPDSTRLRPEAGRILQKVVAVLKDYNLSLVVRGHTDDMVRPTSAYPSNWELSGARAAVALNYILEKGGLPINRAKAVGYADTRPLVSNDSDENRLKNQRVEFYLHMPQRDVW